MCEHCGCRDHVHDHEHGATHTHTVDIELDVLAHERAHAEKLRARLDDLGSSMVNIIGSPGCGKTELIFKLIPKLKKLGLKPLVIEGDLATENDAERIRQTGIPAFQVTTGTACHLTGHDIEHALEHLPLEQGSIVIVENVGNLVCPSIFDLGESMRLVCLSVTEGEDKPQKYPISFQRADLAVITKNDLSPHVDFDLDRCAGMIRQIKPGIDQVVTSAKTGEGLDDLASRLGKLFDR